MIILFTESKYIKQTRNYIFPICHIENIENLVWRSFEGQGQPFWPLTHDYIIYRVQIYKTNKELYFSYLPYWKYRKFSLEVIWRSGSMFLTSNTWLYYLQSPNIYKKQRIIFFPIFHIENIEHLALRSFEGQCQSFWPPTHDYIIYRV